MRLLSLLALTLLAACGSQSRYDYDDPWADYDPTVRHKTYDEEYVPPSAMNADQLADRAEGAEQQGRDDRARVDYHQAFRRDRWHVRANLGYQDLMLRNGLFEDVWQEYLDLWQQHPERGDAFWFHLRPLLMTREGDMPLVRYPDVPDDDMGQVRELAARSADADGDEALAAIEQALQIADLPWLHRVRIDLLHPVGYQPLLDEYAALAEDNPADGDALALHAYVLSMRDVHGALKLLRDAWIIELPGWWLRFGIAEICTQLGEDAMELGETGQGAGWYRTSLAMLLRCVESAPENQRARSMLDEVRAILQEID
jgi:tetratricopeptide (TPR) repeat protein